MANRDLLKEAIADAKAVKKTAIANAKAALEEAFTPMLREKLAAKLDEMDKMEEEESVDEAKHKEKEMKEGYSIDEEDVDEDVTEMEDTFEMKSKTEEGKKELDEMDLEELLRELEAMEEEDVTEGNYMYEEDSVEEGKMKKDDKKKDLKEEEEGLINDPKGPTAHGNVKEEDDVTVTDDEEIDLENMNEDDLKSFIEDVIADMVSAGELEAGDAVEGDDDDDEKGDEGDEMKGAEEAGKEETVAEVKKMKDEVKKMKEAKDKAEKELKEAYDALETIKTELNEVNLFNAKLLYTNKIFKAKNLTESQKVKVLAAFDKAASVKEAKLVFETLSEGFNNKKSTVNESLLRGSASKPAGVAERKPILEVNDQFARWQTLAGIKK